MSSRVGFTGTQQGMTPEQLRELPALIAGALEFHHGDCVGSDEQAHGLALAACLWIKAHPARFKGKRAFCDRCNVVAAAKDPLVRNRDIVDETDRLIATPRWMYEALRSGTWATVRYARKIGRPITIIWPNGNVVHE